VALFTFDVPVRYISAIGAIRGLDWPLALTALGIDWTEDDTMKLIVISIQMSNMSDLSLCHKYGNCAKVGVRRRCDPLLNYFGHLLYLAKFARYRRAGGFRLRLSE